MSRQDALRRAWATARTERKAQFVFLRDRDYVIQDAPPPLDEWPHSEALQVEFGGT